MNNILIISRDFLFFSLPVPTAITFYFDSMKNCWMRKVKRRGKQEMFDLTDKTLEGQGNK